MCVYLLCVCVPEREQVSFIHVWFPLKTTHVYLICFSPQNPFSNTKLSRDEWKDTSGTEENFLSPLGFFFALSDPRY